MHGSTNVKHGHTVSEAPSFHIYPAQHMKTIHCHLHTQRNRCRHSTRPLDTDLKWHVWRHLWEVNTYKTTSQTQKKQDIP